MTQQASTTPQVLADAFVTFNRMSEQLASSYRELESRVSQLTNELDTARLERSMESLARERVAKRLETLLDALPGGVIVLDNQGVVQECNPAAEALLGHGLEGQRWNDVIARAFAPRTDDGHDVSLADGRRVNISTCPMGDEPGQILLITDVTEMRRLQDHLTQHQRLATMGEMAASLAHQVRTPLSSALLYASNLKRPQLDEGDRERFTGKLLDQLRHLEALVNDMLLYARDGTMGEQEFEPADLIGDLQRTLASEIEASRTRFECRNHTSGMRLHGNRQLLVSALANLASNAMQAMGEGGLLELDVRSDDEHSVAFVMTDSGPGIEPQQLQKIFNPFYTTRSEGTGLGLAVVAAITRAHGGDIRVVSPAKGRDNGTEMSGSIFSMHLPARKMGTRDNERRREHVAR
ncbi:MAG TPA: PAS domain-containing protein [Gammaproteobacteria bacterium]|nr:PAS domain-containing protein [Gammaproteobacteria bacterium]